ncbi:MAG: hypothetical protein CBC68_02120 [Candidatus Marinimicrobia bacterium TMED108]|nr:MAG: hypothetical protein CBC68_02120 [Candidatus Marinimicrobia bacterium TMED108]
MPVGEADKGIGAVKGKAYYGVQVQTSIIDWWHDPIESNEPYKHSGKLNTVLVRPSLIYGVSNKINLALSTQIGVRSMVWDQNSSSIHHRTETTLDGFNNANPGWLGDSKIILRYLAKNDGMGEGLRVILGGGLSVPSNNVLTSDPFFLKGEKKTDHRHFSLSTGSYKYILESQLFFKRPANPVFFGGFLVYEHPISENEHNYLAPPLLNISLSATFKRFDKSDSSLGYGVGILQSGNGYWHGIREPNSKSLSISPTISYLLNASGGAISFNISKPFFFEGSFYSNEGDIGQGSNIWQFAVSFRKI